MEQYRTAFTQADLSALVDCFAFPLQMVSASDAEASGSVANLDEWWGVLKRLLSAYKRLGVTDCVPLAAESTELMDAVAVMRVHWAPAPGASRAGLRLHYGVHARACRRPAPDRGARARRTPEDARRPAGALTAAPRAWRQSTNSRRRIPS